MSKLAQLIPRDTRTRKQKLAHKIALAEAWVKSGSTSEGAMAWRRWLEDYRAGRVKS